MLSKKDLKILESIIMLQAIKENFSKREAAKKLFISIDTLNRYIEDFEMELGLKLVLVNQGRTCLTKIGEKIVNEARQIEECLKKVDEFELVGRGNIIHIGYDKNLYLPQLSLVYKNFPQCSFSFDFVESLIDMDQTHYDVYLSFLVPKGKDLEVVYKKNFLCGFFASNEYLEKRGYPKNNEDFFRKHKFVLKQDYLSQLADLKIAKEQVQVISNSTYIITQAINESEGIGVLPLFRSAEKNLVYLNNISCPVEGTVYLVVRKSIKDEPLMKKLIAYYITFLEKILF